MYHSNRLAKDDLQQEKNEQFEDEEDQPFETAASAIKDTANKQMGNADLRCQQNPEFQNLIQNMEERSFYQFELTPLQNQTIPPNFNHSYEKNNMNVYNQADSSISIEQDLMQHDARNYNVTASINNSICNLKNSMIIREKHSKMQKSMLQCQIHNQNNSSISQKTFLNSQLSGVHSQSTFGCQHAIIGKNINNSND